MNCMEARRMVTPFVKKELSDKDTEAFLAHIEHCSDCMDELDIYYTVYHVLNLLDSGAHHEYDFRKMMEEDIRTAKRYLLRKRVARWLRLAGCLAAELLLLLTVITGMRIRAGKNGLLENLRQKVQLIWEVPEMESQSEAETETESETEIESETGTEKETAAETETKTGIVAEPEMKAGTVTESETKTETKPESRAETKPETEA